MWGRQRWPARCRAPPARPRQSPSLRRCHAPAPATSRRSPRPRLRARLRPARRSGRTADHLDRSQFATCSPSTNDGVLAALGRRRELQVQRPEPAEQEGRLPLVAARHGRPVLVFTDADVAEAVEQPLERDPGFGTSERRAGGGGADTLEAVIEVPFRVAMLGGQIPVTLPITDTCPTCKGSGGAPGASWSTCPECQGRGNISFGQGSFAVNRPCPQCRGRGQVPSQKCPTCNGAGEVRSERRVTITVPSATENGDRVLLRGQGQPSRPGGPPGDLVSTFQVQPDRFFRREGLDIHAEVPINLAQAALGTRIRVRTLDGKKVLLRIPPGTQPGRKFRIKGQGLEKNGRRGDQVVGVQVTVPQTLTAEQQELMKRFADSAGLKY